MSPGCLRKSSPLGHLAALALAVATFAVLPSVAAAAAAAPASLQPSAPKMAGVHRRRHTWQSLPRFCTSLPPMLPALPTEARGPQEGSPAPPKEPDLGDCRRQWARRWPRRRHCCGGDAARAHGVAAAEARGKPRTRRLLAAAARPRTGGRFCWSGAVKRRRSCCLLWAAKRSAIGRLGDCRRLCWCHSRRGAGCPCCRRRGRRITTTSPSRRTRRTTTTSGGGAPRQAAPARSGSRSGAGTSCGTSTRRQAWIPTPSSAPRFRLTTSTSSSRKNSGAPSGTARRGSGGAEGPRPTGGETVSTRRRWPSTGTAWVKRGLGSLPQHEIRADAAQPSDARQCTLHLN